MRMTSGELHIANESSRSVARWPRSTRRGVSSTGTGTCTVMAARHGSAASSWLARQILVQLVEKVVGLEEPVGPAVELCQRLLLLELVGGLVGLDAGLDDRGRALEHGEERAQLLGGGDRTVARDDLGVGGDLLEQLLEVGDQALDTAA